MGRANGMLARMSSAVSARPADGFIGSFDHPKLGALHPVNALLIVGLSFHISRDRAGAAPAP